MSDVETKVTAEIQSGVIIGLDTALEIIKNCKSQENAIATLEEFILRERIKRNYEY